MRCPPAIAVAVVALTRSKVLCGVKKIAVCVRGRARLGTAPKSEAFTSGKRSLWLGT